MLITATRTLNILAAAVWLIGGVVLLLKTGDLLAEATHLRPGWLWPAMSMAAGLLIGGIKSRFIFVKSCHKNLNRIAALPNPRLWQFYSPRFFVMLAVMISVGVALSRLAHGSYAFLLTVAALDLTIAVALLSSSVVYWQRRAFAPAAEPAPEQV